MKRVLLIIIVFFVTFFSFALHAQVPEVKWDRHSLIIDGHRVVPVMGEIHYSRIPYNEWAKEIRKMKLGGVTIIATYVFWNHIEEQQGIFDWSGQRNLRRFIELCKDENLPVILRIGPYCHGEVRCGGIPDWVVNSGCRLRSEDVEFLGYVETLYRQIFTQIQGLQWKDGGPIMACQFDNEFGGNGSYLMALKGIAKRIGYDLPFYTRTGWPEMRTPTPFGEMIPLYGDYADGFWDRTIKEGAGNYWKAFHFKGFRSSTAIASEQIKDQKEKLTKGDEQYPYFTCELGGGMMTSYHRRVFLYPEDAYSMALVKLGSGSNLLGYYMYHGGTNPEGKLTYLNENQKTKATNHNDLPVKTYDFQAPLGEFGQENPHYYSLRPLHLFMHDFGEMLAPLEAVFPIGQEAKKHDDSYLRWSYRAKGTGFVFVNNYERFANLTAKSGVQFDVEGVKFPRKPITIPAGMMTIFPVNIALPDGNVINYATAQPVAYRDGKMWFERKDGIIAEFSIDGKVRIVKQTSTTKPFMTIGGVQLFLITTEEAGRLFLPDDNNDISLSTLKLNVKKEKETGAMRNVTIGVQKVAEEPVDKDFEQAAVYRIDLPKDGPARRGMMEINYCGDVARLYANGQLIGDNFYNGRPFLMGLWRVPTDVTELELRILPLQENMPVYFPREADTTPGEKVNSVTVSYGNSSEGKTMVVIGDSYVRNHRRPYQETWHARVAERLGMNYRNYGRNGNCIAFDRTNRGFGKPILERYTEMTDTADLVMVIAGHNDAVIVKDNADTLEIFRRRLDSLCVALRNKYPQAAICFVTPWAVESSGFEVVTQSIREACARHHFGLLDAARESGIRPMDEEFRKKFFQAPNDQAHLNAKGHALLLDWGENFVRNMLKSHQNAKK